ncbi:hypothetical protein ACOME3_004182 [Neoechinorhynchus agilis]
MELGDIDTKRDWGHAKDYVEAMWLMLQQDEPTDIVIATGECHSVREFVEESFRIVDTQIRWQGKGVEEVGIDTSSEKVRVRVNQKYFRPTEVDLLIGNPSKAKKKLNWAPRYNFKEIVEEMVKADIELMKKNPSA